MAAATEATPMSTTPTLIPYLAVAGAASAIVGPATLGGGWTITEHPIESGY